MQSKDILSSILNLEEKIELGPLLEGLLPIRDETSYTLVEIDGMIDSYLETIQTTERSNNDHFDIVLHKKNLDQLENLYRNLHNTQLDVMKLQCDIAFTKEQYDSVKSLCNSSLIQERRELQIKEDHLKKSLQQLKFEPFKNFFDRFANYISSRVEVCQKMCSHQASTYLQTFPWAQYHQAIFLLRACGKALIDVSSFERLYQSSIDIGSLKFKQPIEQMDLNNFIEFQDAYTIESQLEVTLSSNHKQDLKDFLSDSKISTNLNIENHIDYVVFESIHQKLNSITIDCCKLLVDLNMDYIEAHLTDGITIDKLNGGDGTSLTSPEEQVLPLYAFSPQEYITQIGQHLLTLRKQTEQFDTIDNKSLRFALENLQQLRNVQIDIKSFKTVTQIIMSCIAKHCIRSLLGRTSNSILTKLTLNGKRQLATDALYLDNVLEDLGLLDINDSNVVKFKGLLVQ